MNREWLSEAGYRLVFQRRSTGRCFVWLFDRQGAAMLAHEFEYHQQVQAEREAESLAGLGRMREASNHAA
ncbi:MAG: hypothetical protein ACXVDA_09660 [Ktedonobacterales bacterium]